MRSGEQRLWIPAEVLLVATNLTALLMLSRIFIDASFRGPIIFTTLVAHGLLIALRYAGFGTIASTLASLLGTAVAIMAIHYSGTSFAAVVPTSATIDQLSFDLRDAQNVFESLKAPVPAVTGFLVVSSVAFWVVAASADWAAFRLRSPGQALVPAVTVLVFVSLLGIEDGRVRSTATLLVCGLLFVLAHRSAERALAGTWLDEGPTRGFTAIMTAGLVVGVLASLVGVIGGPMVPGADEEPLVELGDASRESNKPLEVISPLVQIQPRLVDQSDVALFTVESTERAWWRIAALDEFDGSLWRSQGKFSSANDTLPVSYPSSIGGTTVTQTFDLSDLNVLWMPAAYLPTSFDNLTETGVNYEAESATLIVDSDDQATSDGLVYRVVSQIPNFDSATLQRLGSSEPVGIDPKYLALPSDFSPVVRAEAERIVAGLTDRHSQALALQNYFRTNFTYDLDVAKGHDIRRLEDFLTIQRGYCEQFAGTFAAMARAIGLPSRVATGFTTGDRDPENPDQFIVRGKHAHAWPEVYIDGAGWIAYHPTPGRGAPNTVDYTGVPEAQDSFTPPATETPPEEAAEQPAEAAGAAPTPTPVPTPSADSERPQLEPEPVPEPERPVITRWTVTTLLALAAFFLWIFGVPALKRHRRRSRVARAGDDTRKLIALSWSATVDRLEMVGLGPDHGETLHEYSARMVADSNGPGPDFASLTELAVEAAYRPDGPRAASVDAAQQLARRVEATMLNRQSWAARNVHEIDPRPLLGTDQVAARAERLAAGATAVSEPTRQT